MTIRFYLDAYKRKDGMQKVLCEIKQSGWIERLKTGIYATPPQWNQGKQRVRANHPVSVAANSLIDKMRGDLNRLHLEFLRDDLPALPENVKAAYLKGKGEGGGFWPGYEEFIGGKKENTRRAYAGLRKDLEAFAGDMGKRVSFQDIGISWVDAFAGYLQGCGGSANTIATRLSLLKSYLSHAARKGVNKNDAYRHITVRRKKTPQIILTAEEVERLINAAFVPRLAEIRDLFIFQVYTGLRVSDTGAARIEGNSLLVQTKKTETPLTLKVNGAAIKIFESYGGVLPIFSHEKYNKGIKEICKEVGINKQVHYRGRLVKKWEAAGSHTARRTCAALLYANGMPLKEISLILGHSSVTTTEDYLRHLTPGGDLTGL